MFLYLHRSVTEYWSDGACDEIAHAGADEIGYTASESQAQDRILELASAYEGALRNTWYRPGVEIDSFQGATQIRIVTETLGFSGEDDTRCSLRTIRRDIFECVPVQ